MNILILARKSLQFNDRIVRQVMALCQEGHHVTVISIKNPKPSLLEKTKHANFIEINNNLNSQLANRLIACYIKLINLIFMFSKRQTKKTINSACQIQAVVENDTLSYPLEKQKLTLQTKHKLMPIISLIKSFQFAKFASQIVSENTFEFIQAHDCYALLALNKLKKTNSSAKTAFDILEITGHEAGAAYEGIPEIYRKLEWIFYKKVAKKVDVAFGIGPSLCKWAQNFYSLQEVHVVRNCKLYTPYVRSLAIRHDLNLKPHEKVIIFCGQIYENANVEMLINVLEFLPCHLHMVLVGPFTQPYAEYLNTKAKIYKKEKQFHIIREKDPLVLIEYLSGADIGIIPRNSNKLNNFYSLPNKFFEMVMARLPILVSHLPDMQSLVEHYHIGKIFKENDLHHLASILIDMCRDNNLNKFKVYYELASQVLCWEKESRVYIDIIHSHLLQTNKNF